MRNFKLKIFTILSALILTCSCFLFAPQKGIEVKASTENEGTISPYETELNFTDTSNSMDISLYGGTKSDILSHYAVYAKSTGLTIMGGTYSGSSLKYSITGVGKTITFKTQFKIADNNKALLRAVENGTINIVLSASTGSISGTCYMMLGNDKVSISSNTAYITTASILTSQTIDIEFGSNSNKLEINEPTIILSTTDMNAPSIKLSDDLDNLAWIKGSSREIKFNVSDSESGIQKTEVYGIKNGSTKTVLSHVESENKKSNSYTFTAEEGYDYYVKTWDNVNNIKEESLINANGLHFDNQSSSLSVSMDSTIHSERFGVSFDYSHDGKSPESSLFYRIVSGKKTTVSIDFTSDTYKTLNTSDLGKMQTIAIKDFFDVVTNGATYTLMARIIDEVGNVTDAVCSFAYDTRKYVSDITLVGGEMTSGLNGSEALGDFTKNTLNVWHGDYVEFRFTNFAGYEFYKIWRYRLKESNGTLEVDKDGNYIIDTNSVEDMTNLVDNNTFGYICTENYGFVIKFRYKVEMTLGNTNFDYTVDDNGDAITQGITYTLNDSSIDTSLIGVKYYYLSNQVDGLKDAGDYTVEWSIDTLDYIGSGEFGLSVKAKNILLNYSNIDGLTYSGSEKTIDIQCNSENVNEAERGKLEFTITCYMYSDSEHTTPVALLNAGTYCAVVVSVSPNYVVTNGNIESIIIAKREVNVVVSKSEFTYSASIQALEYTLDADIETRIEYTIDDNPVDFKNSGTYSYEIVAIDENNYLLVNASGSAIINKAEVEFALEKIEYDYTGNVFTINDIKLSSGGDVNGLYFEAFVGNVATTMLDAGTYTIKFATADTNYILTNTEFEVKVLITSIIITVTDRYEYTGSDIIFEYIVKNDRGEILNVTGLSYEITKNDVQVSSITSVGIYKYKFSTIDPKFNLSGNEGEFEVVKAEISVTMDCLNFEYNESYDYSISFTAMSKFGVDFTSRFRVVILDAENNETTLTDAKSYGFDIVLITADENIEIYEVLSSDLVACDKIINILPKRVEYTIQLNYNYTGQPIDLEYRPVSEFAHTDSVCVEIGEMIDALDYDGVIYSTNINYYIYVDGLVLDSDYKTQFVVTVNKCVVSILGSGENDDVYVYTYSGQKITPSINLSLSSFTAYEIVAKNSNNEVSDIINAGTYTITLNSLNSNYTISGDCALRVEPKSVNIVVDEESLSQEYSKSLKTIVYSIYDGDDLVNISSRVTYFIGDSETTVIYAGEYSYTIEITDSNYFGTLVSDEDSVFVVAKKMINVVATPNQQKVYGDSDIALTYSIDGLCRGDNLDISLSRESGEEVGLYKISINNSEFDDYAINYVESYFKISPKKLLIMVFDSSKTYGEADPVYNYVMYLDGIRVDKLLGTDTLDGSLTRVAGEDKGVYEILQGTISNPNYDIIYSGATLTILPCTIDVSIDDKNVVYGNSESLTYTVEDEFRSVVVGSPSREENNNVGEYPITMGNITAISDNYVLNCVRLGTYTITPKTIYVIALSSSKVYGEVDELEYKVIGLVNGDALKGSLSRASGENVGEYEINIGTLNNVNYSIEFTSSTLSIKQASLSIVIDNKTQVYGNNPQVLTYSVSGLVGTDDVNIELGREGNNDAGSYLIFIKSIEISNNYYLTSYPTGVYTITKADTSINIEPMTCTFTNKVVEFISNSQLNLRYEYTQYGSPIANPINAGVYRVKAYFDGDKNYNSAVSNETTLTILKQSVYIALGETDFIYDGETKYPSFTYDNSLGLEEHQFEYIFVGDVLPIEVGEYDFTVCIKDGLNFTGSASGKVVIKEAFVLSTETGIVECDSATFDDNAQKVELVQTTQTENFNDEKVLSVCSLKSTSGLTTTNGYIYTVKVKATEDITNAKVYKVGANGYQEVALKIENGYFIFSVDTLEDKYIITTDIKKLSSLAWTVIYVLIGVTVFVAIVIVLSKKLGKKKKLSKVSVDKSSKPLQEVEDYHII